MTGAQSYRILIVEDEGLIARDIASRLEGMGHSIVGVVSTAKDAVQEAPNADIILMDIRLDGPGDGIQAAEIIRQHHAKPVVFLTAHADRSTLERAKKAVPYGYVVKPVQTATLAATLDVAVYKHTMERKLAEERSLLDSVVASVADAIIVAGSSGMVRTLNAAAEALTGWSAAEAKGKPVSEVLPLLRGPSATDTEDLVPLALLRGNSLEIGRDCILVRRDGKHVPVEGSAAPVRSDGVLAGVAVSLRDVAAREWHANQVQVAAKVAAATTLAGSISDRYAGLLAGIRTRAAQLLERFPEYTAVRKPLEEIEQAAISGERVNRKLAALAVQDPPRPEPFSLTGLLRRTRKMLESIVGDGVALSVQADPNTRKLWADPAQMERVLLNLVIHAGASLQKKPAEAQKLLVIEVGNAEHSSSNGTLPFVRLTVTYSASEPDGDAIFDPSPLEEDRTALFIAHKIVSEHGGYLAVSATGEYSCFEILLPGQETVASQAATPCEGAIPTVLLVEPLDSLRRELHNYFEAHGIRLLEAANESEAIALAQIHEEPIQVAIVENGGAEILTPALKDLHPDLKLLEITTGDIEPNRHSDASIARPFTEKGLLECVRAMLSHVPQAAAAG